jgi:hypothetical protein
VQEQDQEKGAGAAKAKAKARAGAGATSSQLDLSSQPASKQASQKDCCWQKNCKAFEIQSLFLKPETTTQATGKLISAERLPSLLNPNLVS